MIFQLMNRLSVKSYLTPVVKAKNLVGWESGGSILCLGRPAEYNASLPVKSGYISFVCMNGKGEPQPLCLSLSV